MRRRETRRVTFVAILSAALASVPIGSASAQNPGEIRVTVTELRSDGGFVKLALFEGPDGFPDIRDKAALVVTARIESKRAVAAFRGVPPGEYAIGMYHDENGNGQMDSGIFRIPLEGYGASNDARGKWGPPKFADASFRFDGGLMELRIRTSY